MFQAACLLVVVLIVQINTSLKLCLLPSIQIFVEVTYLQSVIPFQKHSSLILWVLTTEINTALPISASKLYPGAT